MAMYTHVIWDWNGTLLDDVELNMSVVCSLMRKHGLPQSLDLVEYRRLFNYPLSEFYEAVGFDFTKISFEQLQAEFLEAYTTALLKPSLTAGAADAVRDLDAIGAHQHVLSAFESVALHAQVRQSGLFQYFRTVIGALTPDVGSKVELGAFHLRYLRESDDRVVMVGDTIQDYEVATALGFDCVLVAGGHQSEERISACGVPVLSSLHELSSLITA
jgi:phosphoglycolate phosphatase